MTTYKHKNRLHLKVNIPVSQTLSSPDNSSAQYSHTSQANDDEPTPPSSDDMEHNNSTDKVPNYQSSESFTPAIQNNIRIMGQYMVTHLCPPILINQYIPDRTLAEQLHLQRAHCTVKTTNEPYFTHFVNAISIA